MKKIKDATRHIKKKGEIFEMRVKQDISIEEAAKMMPGISAQEIRYGIRNGSLPIGWYGQTEKTGRYHYHIVVARFCKFFRMTKEEFYQQLNKIRANDKKKVA